MSKEKLSPKDLQFSKTDRRVLLRTLEKHYLILLRQWQYHSKTSLPEMTLTRQKAFDRRFRLKVKPVELVLHSLGSELMSHVTVTSIRRTFEIAARSNGAFQSERQTLDNLGRVKYKRRRKI